MYDAVINTRIGEVGIVARIVPIGRKVGSYIDRIGSDRHGRRKIDLLPAGCTFTSEGGCGKPLASGGPQISDMRTCITAAFVESNTGDQTTYVRSELNAEFHCAGISNRWIRRCRRTTPATTWTSRSCSSCEGPDDIRTQGVARQILDTRIAHPTFDRSRIGRRTRKRATRCQCRDERRRVVGNDGWYQCVSSIAQFKGTCRDRRRVRGLAKSSRDRRCHIDAASAGRRRLSGDRRRRCVNDIGDGIVAGDSQEGSVLSAFSSGDYKVNGAAIARDSAKYTINGTHRHHSL